MTKLTRVFVKWGHLGRGSFFHSTAILELQQRYRHMDIFFSLQELSSTVDTQQRFTALVA